MGLQKAVQAVAKKSKIREKKAKDSGPLDSQSLQKTSNEKFNTLPAHELQEIREELKDCHKPLFFFHGDPDGLASFLLLYRMVREGKGVAVKGQSELDESFFKKVEEYGPDKIFVLDIPVIDANFHEKLVNSKIPTVWVDHHDPKIMNGVKYYNPRLYDKTAYIPASYVCFEVAKNDLWIGAVGVAGDGLFPPFADEIRRVYPELLPEDVITADEVLLKSKLGELIKVFSFILNGKTSESNKCVNVLTRIKEPYEILEQSTPAGKFVYERFAKYNKKFTDLLRKAEKIDGDEVLTFIYTSDISFTKDLANEISYKFPDKIIIIGRDKDNEIKMSMRAKKMIIPSILKKSLEGIDGRGGGHEHACGSVVNKDHFERWLQNFKFLSKGKNL